MFASHFLFNAFHASYASYSSNRPVADSQSNAENLAPLSNNGDAAEQELVQSNSANGTNAPVVTSASNNDDDSDQGSGQDSDDTPVASTVVSFSYSSSTMDGVTEKVFSFEMNASLRDYTESSSDGGGQRRFSDFMDNFPARGGRFHGDRFPGGIANAMDRILTAITSRLAEFAGANQSNDVVSEGNNINAAISVGVQNTQQALTDLGVAQQNTVVAEAGQALQESVTQTVDELQNQAATVADASENDATATATVAAASAAANSPSATTANENSNLFKYQAEQESFKAKVKPVFNNGPEFTKFKSKSSGFEMMVETNDGDLVKVNLNQEFLKFKDRSDEALVKGRFSSSDFSFEVSGDLDEGELEALRNLFDQVSELSQKFFNGNVEDAFEFAVDMGLDTSELAGYSLRLFEQTTKAAMRTYGDVANLGQASNANSASIESKQSLDGMAEFVSSLRQTLGSTEAAQFNNARDMIESLLKQQTGAIAAQGGEEKQKNVDNILDKILSELGEAQPLEQAA